MIEVHVLDVGQGNMVVIKFPDGDVMVYDCNITQDNEYSVFRYLKAIMPKYSIDIFVNSHREADHMRGIQKLHQKFPVNSLWDSGVSGNTTAPEYQEYMHFRRSMVKNVQEVYAGQSWKNNMVAILNGKRGVGDQNAQSIVLKINYNGSSILLTGDTDAKVWKDYIMRESSSKTTSAILLASHHGSITFFDDPRDEKHYYISHIQAMNPDIAIISVGINPHGHPDEKAIELYEKYCKGSDQGNKIFRTDKRGNIKVELKGNGSWSIN